MVVLNRVLLIFCMLAFQHLGFASSSLTDDSIYPLGGVWRAGLLPSSLYHALHLQMARAELKMTTEEDRRDQKVKFSSNIALCQLNVYVGKEDDKLTPHEILGVADKLFLSGGYILLEGVSNFFPIVRERDSIIEAIKRKKASISSLLGGLSKLAGDIEPKTPSISPSTISTIPAKLGEAQRSCEQLIKEYEELKTRAAAIHKEELAYESGGVFQDTLYEYANHLYDAEQVIIRHIDRTLKKVKQTEMTLDVRNDLSITKSSIKKVVLHMHTRFDMCQYCLKSFHIRFKEWKNVFKGFPFDIIVSSRQEYIPNAMILYSFPSYQGASMRYLGVDKESRALLSEEDLRKLSERGLIAQIPLSSWDMLGF